MHRLPALLLLLLALGGCAERWVRTGTAEEDADAANAACTQAASLAVPRNMVTRQTSPARVERDRTCTRENNVERCRTTERYVPAQYSNVDLNEGARRDWRFGCMQQKGFRFEGYRPLRLE
jgi:hypothetical protein